MSAGLLEGSCGGILYACCHRSKDAAKSNAADYYSIDGSRDPIETLASDHHESDDLNDDRKWSIKNHSHEFTSCLDQNLFFQNVHTTGKVVQIQLSAWTDWLNEFFF